MAGEEDTLGFRIDAGRVADGYSAAYVSDIWRRDSLNSRFKESLVRRFHAARQTNCPACIFDDQALEIERSTVDGRMAHAEVVCEPTDEQALQPSFANIASQSGGSGVVVLQEGRIGIDVPAKALTQNQLRMRDLKTWMKRRTRRPLHAMVGPERLRAVAGLGHLIWSAPRMCGCERDMSLRMPVLCKDHVLEQSRETIQYRNDLIATLDSQRAARAEVVLQIHHKQDIRG
jgi:hypothetical protein